MKEPYIVALPKAWKIPLLATLLIVFVQPLSVNRLVDLYTCKLILLYSFERFLPLQLVLAYQCNVLGQKFHCMICIIKLEISVHDLHN